MRETIKESIIWTVLIILAGIIGAGIAIIVTSAIEQTRTAACFEYKDPDVCKEVINKAKGQNEKN